MFHSHLSHAPNTLFYILFYFIFSPWNERILVVKCQTHNVRNYNYREDCNPLSLNSFNFSCKDCRELLILQTRSDILFVNICRMCLMKFSADVFTAQIFHASVVELTEKEREKERGKGEVGSRKVPPVRQNRRFSLSLSLSSLIHSSLTPSTSWDWP